MHEHRTGADVLIPLPENRFAQAAVEHLLRARRGLSALVYLSGPSGCGKSLSVRQGLSELRQRDHRLKIVQVEARELVAPKRAAIPGLPDAACSEEAHAPDVFVCEDLQALETSAAAQDRLVAAMDLVRSCGGRAIITGNRLPGEMPLSQKLVSRLHGGICATIRAPDVGSRRRLLEHFSRRANLLLSTDAVQFLAERLGFSPRELAAAVAQLAAMSKAERQGMVSLELARRFVADDVPSPALTIAEIARAVARQFDVPLGDIQSESRMRRLLLPRQCAMYLARELTEDSLAVIGRYFGRSNHSTVAHACHRIRSSLPEEPSLRRQLRAIRQVLRKG